MLARILLRTMINAFIVPKGFERGCAGLGEAGICSELSLSNAVISC